MRDVGGVCCKNSTCLVLFFLLCGLRTLLYNTSLFTLLVVVKVRCYVM